MEFRYVNVNNTAKLSLSVRHGEDEVVFVVKSLFDKTKKHKLDSPHQFELLEQYMDFKGEEFQDRYFDLCIKAFEASSDILDSPVESFGRVITSILDMLDIEEIKAFIQTLDYIRAPSNLKENFDESIVKDGLGTRVQTYTKDEYIDLVALSVVSKAIVGPFGEFTYSNPSAIIMQTKELSLVQMIMDSHHIMNSKPVQKLLGSFDRFISTNMSGTANKTVLLQKMISTDDIKYYLLGLTLFKIMPVNIPRNDKITTNLITFIYSSIKDAIKPPNNVRQKTAKSDGEETESSLEIYRMATDVMVGIPEEFKFFTDDPHKLLRFYNITDTDGVMNDVLQFLRPMTKSNDIDPNIVKLMIWIISITPDNGKREVGIIDPEAIFYLDIEHLVNVMALGFTIAWYRGFPEIALLLSALRTDEDVPIQSTLGKEHIGKDTLKELKQYYSVDKELEIKNKPLQTQDLIAKAINDLVVMLYNSSYRYLATPKYLKGKSRAVSIPEDLREQIAKLLIALHKGE